MEPLDSRQVTGIAEKDGGAVLHRVVFYCQPGLCRFQIPNKDLIESMGKLRMTKQLQDSFAFPVVGQEKKALVIPTR